MPVLKEQVGRGNEDVQDVIQRAQERAELERAGKNGTVPKATTIMGDDFKKFVPSAGIDALQSQADAHQEINEIPAGLNINDHLTLVHSQMAESGIELAGTKKEVNGVIHKMISEKKVESAEWSTPSEVLDILDSYINKIKGKYKGSDLDNKKSALNLLHYDIKGETNIDTVLGKIAVNEGLDENQKKELEALVKGGRVSVDEPVVTNPNPEPVVIEQPVDTISEEPTQFMAESIPVEQDVVPDAPKEFTLPEAFLSDLAELPGQANTPEEKSSLEALVEEMKGLSNKEDADKMITDAFQKGHILLAEANRLHKTLDSDAGVSVAQSSSDLAGIVEAQPVDEPVKAEEIPVAENLPVVPEVVPAVVNEPVVLPNVIPNAYVPSPELLDLKRVEGLSEEEIQKKLSDAEDVYVAESIAYKNELRRQKGLFRRTMSDLGLAGKQMPEPGAMREYLKYYDAQKDYFGALTDRRLKMLERDEIGPLNKPESQMLDKKLMEVKESDTERLQRKINEGLPKLEKGMVRRGLEKWATLSLPTRVATSTVLVTGVGVFFGGVGAVGAVGVGAYRFGRGLAGGVLSQVTGKRVDSVHKKESKERTGKAFEEYVGGTIDRDSLIESEERMATFLESEENQKKRDALKKAGVMMATGAGVAIGSGVLLSEGQSLLHTIHNSHDAIPQAGGSHVKVGLGGDKDVSQIRVAPKTVDAIKGPQQTPVQPPAEMEPIKVELSSKGYIDTFSKLQHDLAEKYPNIKTAPPEVEEILHSTPEKLAIKFGFYKPTAEFESAIGMKGDHLILDKSGNLVLENAKGSQTIFDAKTGTVHEYSGKMLDAETGKISSDVPHADESVVGNADHVDATVQEVPPVSPDGHVEVDATADHQPNDFSVNQLDNGVVHSGSSEVLGTGESHGMVLESYPGATITDYPLRGGMLHVLAGPSGHVEQLSFNDQIITSPVDGHSGLENIVQGHLPLKAEYQFDPQYKGIRNAYNIMYEKMAINEADTLYDYRLPVDYQGGRIQLIQQGNEMTALLNGQKIGSGVISNTGVKFDYNDALGKGLLTKNGFELAFEKAQSVLGEKISMFIKNLEK